MQKSLALLSLTVLISLLSCSPAEHSDKSVFNWNIHGGVTSLDPAFARNQANIWATHQMFNSLVELNDDLRAVPSIAHSWDISDDGKTYTFYLRNDVYFQNHELFPGGEGRLVTANDFVYSLNRLLDPSIASPGAWIFQGKIEITESEDGNRKGRFYADNDTTFRIELLEPFPPMLGLLAMQYCSVIPKEIAEHYGKDFRDNPVGTGPFKKAFWEEGNRLILHRNPNYFETDDAGNSLPYLDAVNISFVPDKQSEFFSFLRGDLDILSGAHHTFQDNLLTRDGQLTRQFKGEFNLEINPFLNTEYLGILVDSNHAIVQNSPLKKKQIRQAINYGFDRSRMMTYLRNNIGKPGVYGFVPRGMAEYDYNRVQGYNYDPARASQLLAEAGFPDGDGLPDITLHTTEGYLEMAVYIQNELEDIGVSLQIEVNPPSMHREWVSRSDVNFFRASWIADYPDPESYLALFYSPHFTPNGPNYTHFSDPVYDSLYETSLSITDDSLRYELYYEMDNLVMENAPVIVLYYDEVVRLLHHHVNGMNRNAVNLIDLKSVYLTRNMQ